MLQRTNQLNNRTYEQFRHLILERSGLHFPEKRRRDLETGLRRAFSETACPDLQAYYDLLARNHTAGQTWERLIAQLTIGETHFFRNRPQFQALQREILPQIIAQKRSTTRQLRIWSAGCATGEEPYSVAILLHTLLADLDRWNITLLATDINREALQRAQRGLYGAWSFRERGWEHLQTRYFIQQGDQWKIVPEIRRMVTFSYLNLVEDPYPSLANNTVAFDLLLCRNVTIYFTPAITQAVIDRFYEALIAGGWLVVGHAEPSLEIYARFEPRNYPGAVFYQKPAPAARFDLSWLEAPEPPRQRPVAPPSPLKKVLPPTPPPQTAPPAAEEKAPPPTPEPAELCAEAEALVEQGQDEAALELLHRAIEQDDHCSRAYYLAGKVYADTGQWEEAHRWCDLALDQDPLLVEARLLLSLIHSQQGHLEEAITEMKRVVYLDRNAILGHFCLANLYREQGHRGRARKSLQNAAHLLEGLPSDAKIPWSDGMTAGRLRYIVQQRLEREEEEGLPNHRFLGLSGL